jgi:thymidylate synthase
MNQLDKQYQELLFDIIENGVDKDTRNGKTRSVFGKQIRHKMKDGFPLLTTKKMYWKGIVTELIWFLRGDTNIKFLVDNDCHIWDGDAYKNYGKRMVDIINVVIPAEFMDKGWVKLDNHGKYGVLSKEEFINKIKTDFKFAEKWGDLGPVYGKQWRGWKGEYVDKSAELGVYTAWVPERIDQIAKLINDLKTNPDSRRLMVSAWNVGELNQMVLPPCHYGFQVYTRKLSVKERMEIYFKQHPDWAMIGEHSFFDKHNIPTRAISLMWNQRSVDTFLGLPFNIASYGLLLEILAKMTNMVPDELIGNLGDVHLYEEHLPQAREQMVRQPYRLPKLKIDDQYWVTDCDLDTHILSMLIEDFTLENYQSHPTIKAPLSN